MFRDPTLHGFVDERILRELFSRTIAFFRIIAHPTSGLHVDLRILEGLERELWGRPNNLDALDHPTGSSFSSSASGGPPHPVPHLAAMPPVAGPVGMHSPVNHAGSGMHMGMSPPPLASPLQATVSGVAAPGPGPGPEGGHGARAAMLPPMQYHPHP